VQEAAVDHEVQLVYWHSVPPEAVHEPTLVHGLVEVTVWHKVAEATV
jgi:hypothetical protein